MDTVLSVEAARAHYDALGQGQDREMRYAEAAFSRLIGATGMSEVGSAVELGPGTGMLAARLLRDHLGPDTTWLGLDISQKMRELAAERLRAFGERVRLEDCEGDGRLPVPDSSTDLLIATYVLDLLSPSAIARFLADAARVLKPGGQLAVAGLAPGTFSHAGLTMTIWTMVQRLAPRMVGGCRPVRLEQRLDPQVWQVTHRSRVTAGGIPSSVLVASLRDG
ncbi:MAG: class I SAM-dependent methyltransferase [Minwuia sp.]|nr:class I SAM-dependent methyltransferase [Minwuia sp.]